VLNAATGHTKVTLSRHGFADGKACLGCLYHPALDDLTTEKRLANELGLELGVVEEYLASNKPVTATLARQIESHRGLASGTLEEWVGQKIQSFHQRAVCGEAAIKTAAGTIVSPLSFISAAAGVLLAAELVKSSAPELRQFELDNYFRIDTLAKPNPDFKETRLPEPTKRCICWDRDYQEIYRRRYSVTKHAVSAGL